MVDYEKNLDNESVLLYNNRKSDIYRGQRTVFVEIQTANKRLFPYRQIE